MVQIDTNVILDVLAGDVQWLAWSLLQLKRAAAAGPLLINDIVYAELSVRFASVGELDAAISGFSARIEPIPRLALFQAGRAFKQYRIRGGSRTGVLPDFFIGAHASAMDHVLLTRDTGRYRSYFLTLRLLTPD